MSLYSLPRALGVLLLFSLSDWLQCWLLLQVRFVRTNYLLQYCGLDGFVCLISICCLIVTLIGKFMLSQWEIKAFVYLCGFVLFDIVLILLWCVCDQCLDYYVET